jgi:hypothetical protein
MIAVFVFFLFLILTVGGRSDRRTLGSSLFVAAFLV